MSIHSWPMSSITEFTLSALIEITWAAICSDHIYSLYLMENPYDMAIIEVGLLHLYIYRVEVKLEDWIHYLGYTTLEQSGLKV